MSWTDYLANKMLDHLFTDAAYTPPATLYWGLSTTTPTAAGTNITEPGSNNYSRVAVAAADMGAAAARSKTNSTELSFPTPSGSWNTVTHAVLFDGSTVGANNALIIVDIADRTISSGDSPKILVSGITHSI